MLTHYKVKSVVHGIAHITGGGLFENLERILPPGVGVTIDRGSWPAAAGVHVAAAVGRRG